MNDSHFCNILDALDVLIGGIDGVNEISDFPSDYRNPPDKFCVAIVPLTESNDPVLGAHHDDGFGTVSKSPTMNRYNRGIMIEVIRRGKKMRQALNLAARIQSAIETSSEISDLVNSVVIEASIPVYGESVSAEAFVSVAISMNIEYSTARGEPDRLVGV